MSETDSQGKRKEDEKLSQEEIDAITERLFKNKRQTESPKPDRNVEIEPKDMKDLSPEAKRERINEIVTRLTEGNQRRVPDSQRSITEPHRVKGILGTYAAI